MKFDYEYFEKFDDVIKSSKECEGKHIQQMVYSTYHKGLTQICFDCKKIRSMIKL